MLLTCPVATPPAALQLLRCLSLQLNQDWIRCVIQVLQFTCHKQCSAFASNSVTLSLSITLSSFALTLPLILSFPHCCRPTLARAAANEKQVQPSNKPQGFASTRLSRSSGMSKLPRTCCCCCCWKKTITLALNSLTHHFTLMQNGLLLQHQQQQQQQHQLQRQAAAQMGVVKAQAKQALSCRHRREIKWEAAPSRAPSSSSSSSFGHGHDKRSTVMLKVI